ncbi:MAG TPA: hypothetical protein PKD45_00530 [Flavobacteriales bacterium]|nr:hypothetical protein [Flavobacteriales bacterium]
MGRILAFSAALLVTCTACNNQASHADTPPPDRSWEGELRILPNDTSFRPCGTHKTYRVTGPGLDSLARRYTWLHTAHGQWIKTWCSGHLAPGTAAAGDSLLVATAYQHMDVEVQCPPAPVDSLAGSYLAEAEVTGGKHTEQLELLPDGSALIITSTPALYAEVDGLWGLDSDGVITFQEIQGRYFLHYAWIDGHLVRPLPNRNAQVTYTRTGQAQRLSGAFGRTAWWLSEVAHNTGNAHLQAEDLRPAMRLDSLFPDAEARALLADQAQDTLGMSLHDVATLWQTAETVYDVTRLMRIRRMSRAREAANRQSP